MGLIQNRKGWGGSSDYKGYFATVADLQVAYPLGSTGRFAIVGSAMYIWNSVSSTRVTNGISVQVGTGSPIGVATPAFLGQTYFDNDPGTGPAFYRAIGLTSNDWLLA